MGEYLNERGERVAEVTVGVGAAAAVDKYLGQVAESVDPGWAHLITDFTMNGMYARTILPTSTQELCAVAALTVLQRTEELVDHLRIALRTNPAVEVREVILQMSLWGGVPVTVSTLKLFDAILAEDEFAAKRTELHG